MPKDDIIALSPDYQSDVFIWYHSWLKQHQHQSVQSLSHVQLFVTPWTASSQASLSITKSQSLLKLMSIQSVMPSNHLILCCPLLFLPSRSHPAIASSVVPFSCLQSFPASGCIKVSQLFKTGGQSIRVSGSASVLPMNIQD